MDSNLYSRNYNHSETCPSPRASHGISVTCLQGVLICSCLTTVAFQEGAVWKDVVTVDAGIGKWVLKKITQETGERCLCSYPLTSEWRQCRGKELQNRSRDQCSGRNKQSSGKSLKTELCPNHTRVPHIWSKGTKFWRFRREASKPIAFPPFLTRLSRLGTRLKATSNRPAAEMDLVTDSEWFSTSDGSFDNHSSPDLNSSSFRTALS